jgi:hypothetical protein
LKNYDYRKISGAQKSGCCSPKNLKKKDIKTKTAGKGKTLKTDKDWCVLISVETGFVQLKFCFFAF